MKFVKIIDSISELTGRIFSPVLLFIMAFAIYEVMMRYLFSKPSIWVWEINSHLMCLLGAMAGCYTLLKGSHVSVDIVPSRLSQRNRALLEVLTAPIFFVFVGCLIWFGTKEAIRAYQVNLRVISQLGSPLWPVKFVIPLGGLLILLQGSANFIRNIQIAIGKQED